MPRPKRVDDFKSSSSGLIFHLHPLALINISDHYTRTLANGSKSSCRVFGCLLGQQTGRDVSVSNSFELIVREDASPPAIDEDFLAKKQEQYKQTFADLDIVGWYATGSKPDPTDLLLHRQIMALNESPVFLLLDTGISLRHRDLPIILLESEVRDRLTSPSSKYALLTQGDIAELIHVHGSQQLVFARAEHTVQTSEAERIAVNQVAKVLASGNDGAADQVSAHYSNLASAIKILNERVTALHSSLKEMAEGRTALDYALMREASSLLKRLPAIKSPGFKAEYLTEFNDALLTVLLSSVTSGSNTLLDIVDKCNVAYGRP